MAEDTLNLSMKHTGTMDLGSECQFTGRGGFPIYFGWSTFPSCCGVATIYALAGIRQQPPEIVDKILAGIRERLTKLYGMATAVIVTGQKNFRGGVVRTYYEEAFTRNGWVAVYSCINPNSNNEITLFVLDLTKKKETT